MASYNRYDEQQIRRGIEEWLPERLGVHDLRVTKLSTPAASGASALTFLFDVAYRDETGAETEEGFVARVVPKDPNAGGLFMRYDLDLEAALMRAAAPLVPVADLVAVEATDTKVFGNPFLITRFINGRVVSDAPPLTSPDSWVWSLPEAGQAKLADECLRALVAVQRADLQPGLLPAPGTSNAIAALIDDWEAYYHWAKRPEDDRPHRVFDATLAYLRANLPDDEPMVVNWGDSRIGNMVYGADLETLAVLDWEMACHGSPEIDLGWFLFHMRWTTEGYGLPQLPGFPSETQVVERFEELSGHIVRHRHFYEMFAGLRMVALGIRHAVLLEDAGVVPKDADIARNNPGVQVTERLLEQGAGV